MKTVIIPKGLYKELEQEITTNNKETNYLLKLDFAVYLISLIISLPTFNRQSGMKANYVRLSSTKLRNLHHRYQDYLKFLLSKGFIIKIKNYGVEVKTCNTYQISEQYLKDRIVGYTLTDKFLLNKFNKAGQDKSHVLKMKIAAEKRPHLISSFNNKLGMDCKGAHNEILNFLDTNPVKYLSASQLILEWHQKAWNYSIKPQTDNRLHTTLTRTNRVLRKYIRYGGKELVAVDIKTSQPYFLCPILKGIINRDICLLERIGVLHIIGQNLLDKLFDLKIDVQNARYFADLVVKRDLYKVLTNIIPIQYDSEKPYRMVWPSDNWKGSKEKKHYKSERDLAKEVMLEFFNGSPKSKKREVVAIRDEFPAIVDLVTCLNNNGIEFYRLLCHVEAHCLLDIVGAKIHKEFKDMPLFSIHDSLVTTKNYASTLELTTQFLLENFTGFTPKLELEFWRTRNNNLLKKLSNLP